MRTFVVTYSYATTDRYYRGQRTTVVRAKDESAALAAIREGRILGQAAVPSARLVRIRERTDPAGDDFPFDEA